MSKQKADKPKRLVVFVEGGFAEALADQGIDWELVDWDNLKTGHDSWTPEEVETFATWSKGLVSDDVIARLREYANNKDHEDAE